MVSSAGRSRRRSCPHPSLTVKSNRAGVSLRPTLLSSGCARPANDHSFDMSGRIPGRQARRPDSPVPCRSAAPRLAVGWGGWQSKVFGGNVSLQERGRHGRSPRLADPARRQDRAVRRERAAARASSPTASRSYGYDVRVGRHFKVFTNARCAVVDPKNFDPASFVDIEGDYCLIPPNSFALAETVEYLEIPRDIIAHLRREKHVCALRHHRQRNAPGAGVARQGHHRDQQHDAAAGQDLRRRRHRPDPLPARRGRLPAPATATRRASTRTRRA